MLRAAEERESSMCFARGCEVRISRFSASMHMHLFVHFTTTANHITVNDFTITVGVRNSLP